MLVSDVRLRAYDIIQDATQIRWTEAEFLRWLNEGIKEIVKNRPGSNPVTVVAPLVAGTRQILPADGYMLLDVVRNMGFDGSRAGRAVRALDKDQLDREQPTWHSDVNTLKGEIRGYCYDERNPKVFYVWPQPVPTKLMQVEILMSVMPDDVGGDSDDLPLADEWAATLVNYVLFRFYGKDAESNGSQTAALASSYYQAFTTSIGTVTTLTTTEGAKQGRD